MDKLKHKTLRTLSVAVVAYLCLIFAQIAMTSFETVNLAVKFVLFIIAVLFGYLLFAARNGTFYIARNRWSDVADCAQKGTFQEGDCIYSCNPAAINKILRSLKTKRVVSLLLFIFLAFVFCIPGFYTQPLHSFFSVLVELCENLGKIFTKTFNTNLFFHRGSALHRMVAPTTLQFFLLTISARWLFGMHFHAGVRNPSLNKIGSPSNA